MQIKMQLSRYSIIYFNGRIWVKLRQEGKKVLISIYHLNYQHIGRLFLYLIALNKAETEAGSVDRSWIVKSLSFCSFPEAWDIPDFFFFSHGLSTCIFQHLVGYFIFCNPCKHLPPTCLWMDSIIFFFGVSGDSLCDLGWGFSTGMHSLNGVMPPLGHSPDIQLSQLYLGQLNVSWGLLLGFKFAWLFFSVQYNTSDWSLLKRPRASCRLCWPKAHMTQILLYMSIEDASEFDPCSAPWNSALALWSWYVPYCWASGSHLNPRPLQCSRGCRDLCNAGIKHPERVQEQKIGTKTPLKHEWRLSVTYNFLKGNAMQILRGSI